jgi:voltage-gated potassium channel
VFLADYVISLILAPDRVQFIKTHIPQAIGVLFPPLRILLIFHVTYEVARNTRGRFGQRARLYLLYLTTLVVLGSSVAVLIVERNAPVPRSSVSGTPCGGAPRPSPRSDTATCTR